MFALESAMDELAVAPASTRSSCACATSRRVDPESGLPFSSRNLVACLREGAERFGWADRDPTPGAAARRALAGRHRRRRRRPTRPTSRPSQASARAPSRRRVRRRASRAADIGTGARTALTQIAADALGVALERVRVEIGDSACRTRGVAGGSTGTASWGSAVVEACAGCCATRRRRRRSTAEVTADTAEVAAERPSRARLRRAVRRGARRRRHRRGPRAAACSACSPPGRIVNPTHARSQLIGGMTMGLSMALHEESVMDREFGDFLNHDLAAVPRRRVRRRRRHRGALDRRGRRQLNPMGAKGIGEIGIVGAPPPSAGSTQMRPPWASTTRRQTARPMPVPSVSARARANIPKIRPACSGIDADAVVAHGHDPVRRGPSAADDPDARRGARRGTSTALPTRFCSRRRS